MEIINALLIEPGEPPVLVLLENPLESIHGLIDGDIAAVQPWNDTMVAFFSRHGMKRGLQPNRMLVRDSDSTPVAPVYGTLLLCNAAEKMKKGTECVFRSMNLLQALVYFHRFSVPDIITTDENGSDLEGIYPKTRKRIIRK